MVFGLMLIAFFYTLAVALILGMPFHYLLGRIGKQKIIYYATAGAVVGPAIMIAHLEAISEFDASAVKLTIVLAVAGVLAGATFHRFLTQKPASAES